MITDLETQSLVARFGAVNVENAMILLMLATDRKGLAVYIKPEGPRVRDILLAMFRGTPHHVEASGEKTE